MIAQINNQTPMWFCLRSQPKREHIAAANLSERVAIETFAPRIRVARSSRLGLVGSVAEALFPGYLFARFVYQQQVRHVISTTGVAGIVAFGGEPPTITDEVIDFLRAHVGSSLPASTLPVFIEGTWVKIISGCFQNAEGRVLHFDPRTERVRLLLTLLGSDVQVSVPAQRLMNADKPLAHYPAGLLANVETSALRSERSA